MWKNNFSAVLFIIGINFFWASTFDLRNDQRINNNKYQSDVQEKTFKSRKRSSITDENHDFTKQPRLLADTVDEQGKDLTVIGLGLDKLKKPRKMTRDEFEKISLHYLKMMEPDDLNADWRTKRKRMRNKKLAKKNRQESYTMYNN